MLSKEICIHCINLIAKRSPWHRRDEDNWEYNEVSCPDEVSVDNVKDLTEPPPKWCPYVFNHAVVSGMTDVE